jgi:hypothetical protein
VARENLRPTIEVLPDPPPDSKKAAAERNFHFWKRTALHFVIGGNASGLIVVLGLNYFSPAAIPGFFALAFVFFALGIFCAGAVIFANWRHSATYVANELDVGLLDAIPQRIGEWFTSHSGWLLVASQLLFCLGIVVGQISMFATF